MSQSILLVDDDPAQIRVLGRILAGSGNLRFATSGAAALIVARDAAPDLILLDAEMPGMSGYELCAALKADVALAHIPVIFVTSHCDASFEVAGFEIGAADFIAKPVNAPLVLARVRTQLRFKRMADELRCIATIDALTGVANRRRLDDSMSREWGRARRSGSALSVVMIDVDHFKSFNDHRGHIAGDDCLRSIAQALARICLRPADLVARYGGEEFVILLPETDREGASHVARNVLAAMRELDIPHPASSTAPHVTVSVGVACYDTDSPCWGLSLSDSRFLADLSMHCSAVDLLRAADQALYAAKDGGRAQAYLVDLADVDQPLRMQVVAEWAPGSRALETQVRRVH